MFTREGVGRDVVEEEETSDAVFTREGRELEGQIESGGLLDEGRKEVED